MAANTTMKAPAIRPAEPELELELELDRVDAITLKITENGINTRTNSGPLETVALMPRRLRVLLRLGLLFF
jgi:hypothetical protein